MLPNICAGCCPCSLPPCVIERNFATNCFAFLLFLTFFQSANCVHISNGRLSTKKPTPSYRSKSKVASDVSFCRMVGKVLIVLNGGRVSKKTLALWIASADHVIAADGGANALADAELHPNTILGDFDSIRPGLENFFENAKFLPDPSQQFTDFQKSIRFAVESLRATKVAIIGAEGDRVDHLLSTFGTAADFAGKADIRFVLETMICYVVAGDSHFSVSPGKTVSLIPLPTATVTATGLEYPVEYLSLSFGKNDGVSNRAMTDSLDIRVHDGTLAVFIEMDPGVVDW